MTVIYVNLAMETENQQDEIQGHIRVNVLIIKYN